MSPISASVRSMIESLLLDAIEKGGPTEDGATAQCAAAIEQLGDAVFNHYQRRETTLVRKIRGSDHAFRRRNYVRWKRGFDMLAVLRLTSLEVGQLFQAEFLRHPQFVHDPLLGVLLRLHAHACRVLGEIEALLHSGYPDAAHARWRTLHEIAVFSSIIRTHGRAAAEDFIHYGTIEAINGMESYQTTADAMNRRPYSADELDAAFKLRSHLIEQCGHGITSSHGWARKYVGSSRFPKLQEAAGLGKWANDYKAASRSIHFDYREMKSLLGMTEASEDLLLCGQSNSGMTAPAHCAAIALVQVTETFLSCYAEVEGCPIDRSSTPIMLRLLGRMEAEVGARFLEAETASKPIPKVASRKRRRKS